jgi:predicted nucleotidyltransferase
VDEDLHVQTIINDLIKFGVVENKADFIRKAIDVYCNYNNVCSENKLEQPLVLPVPDGKNDSVAVQPKLLRNSLFKAISKIQSF